MAGGWAKDGAVQDQIDASVAEAVKHARSQMARGESLAECETCGVSIPPARLSRTRCTSVRCLPGGGRFSATAHRPDQPARE